MKLLLLSALCLVWAIPANAQFPVTITVDAAKSLGELKPIWRMFGADEPNYATMKDGKKLLAELGELRPNDIFFRAHNLLCTGDGTPALKWGSTGIYTEDKEGKPIYNWTVIDRIFDTYRARGVRPYLQIGFMPEALSIHPEPYQHEWRPGAGYNRIATGWSYPPKDYARFAGLVYQWVKHCVDRYGRAEVEHWYFEVWNESNSSSYWHGTPEDLYKLHDFAVDAVRRALPTARVGGPDMAGTGGRFMENFMKHVVDGTNYATGQRGTPTDFLSFHAKGSPGFVDGHVRLGIAAQLRTIDQGFAMIANVPELKNKPIVIGESDPDGCAACQGPQLGYRNTTMYSSYTAATFGREHALAARRGVNLDAALTWAFEFEDQPFFAGQRTLANNGIDLPVMNVFRMFSRMSGQRIEASSSEETPLDDILRNGVRGKPDVGALASIDAKKLTVLTWYYHDDDVAGPDADIEFTLNHLPLANGEARLAQYRIDRTHSNAFTVWQNLGSPTAPTDAQYAQLLKAGQLEADSLSPAAVSVKDGTAKLKLTLPRQGVSLLVLEW
ncbi:MAG: beta-xylosidase [Candidatus Sulfopaludibacter sp.]|nr:beta-xylosidase [Candidatus Sulfopaludibacter sp.]